MTRTFAAAVAAMLIATPLAAQQGRPASPRDTTEATIGSAKVLIDYGRPSKRNREIFGGLVPYDQIWRTGANAATTLITDKPLTIGGTAVPAGRYTIYSIPGRERWQLVVNRQTGQWGTAYDQSQDLARIPMQTRRSAQPVEQFEIAIAGSGASRTLELRWDTTVAHVPIAEGKR